MAELPAALGGGSFIHSVFSFFWRLGERSLLQRLFIVLLETACGTPVLLRISIKLVFRHISPSLVILVPGALIILSDFFLLRFDASADFFHLLYQLVNCRLQVL